MAPPTTRDGRQNNGALLWLLAALAALGMYTMRITTAMNGIPVDFLESIQAGTLIDGSPIKKDYTGFQLLDEGLSFLVAAFLYGPAGWNEPYYWQQIHFLPQIVPIIMVMTVEACRERNQSSWLKYTTIWAFVYQNVGGAVIITIWWILFHRMSNPNSYYQSGREVSLSYARMILPGIVLFYVIPTFAIWLPADKSLSTLQSVLAFWQFTPLFVNIPLWLVSLTCSPATTPKTKNSDVFHLRMLYAFSFVLSVAVHWYTIYGISVSPNPDVNYASVFIPSMHTWDRDIAWGLLWIFQWDWVIFALTYFIAAWVAVCDVQRAKKGEASLGNIFESFLFLMAITVVGGPGAGLSAAWYWREGNLAAIEGGSAAKKGQ